jgi:uncharacterized Fe-S cluster protein YjdI
MRATPRSEAREYATDEVVVEWRPHLCFHSRKCMRALPQVFDAERRPWIDASAADADEVEAAVDGCPSGALRLRRLDDRGRPPRTQVEVSAMPNGPLLVRGPIRIERADGSVEQVPRAAFCRCFRA